MLEQKDLWIVLFVKIILRSSGVLSTLLPMGPLIKYLMKFCLLYHPSHQRSILQLFLCNKLCHASSKQQAQDFLVKKMCEDVMDSCGCAQQPKLEKVSAVPIIARATIEAMFILSQIIASVSDQSYVQRGFSDALFHQLLQAMLHPDVQTRINSSSNFCCYPCTNICFSKI